LTIQVDLVGAIKRFLTPWVRDADRFLVSTRWNRHDSWCGNRRARRGAPVTHFIYDPWFKSIELKSPGEMDYRRCAASPAAGSVSTTDTMTSRIFTTCQRRPSPRLDSPGGEQILEELTAAGFQFPDPSKRWGSDPREETPPNRERRVVSSLSCRA
jgi:hypothetical protein